MKFPKFKKLSFHLSLYLIVPVVIAGMPALASLVSFRITEYQFQHNLDTAWPVVWWTLTIAALGFGLGLLVVRLLLGPARDLVEKAEAMSVLTGADRVEEKEARVDQLTRYHRIFERVATVLSQVDVRQLFPKIIGDSLAMREVLSQVVKVAPTDSTVLIVGESGTGKELIATSIHEHSRRSEGPLIKLNCAAIPETLLESELFGHQKGAYTGAHETKKGKFELANGGALFLDEIGDMPLSTQAKILRVLQEKEIIRVGGSTNIPVDVRFIAATNKNLEQMVAEGTFREDLYYRLNVLALGLPPLRERTEDIPLLANHFLRRSHPDKKIGPMAMQLLIAHTWPGNVRELQNAIERAAILSESDVIQPANMPNGLSAALDRAPETIPLRFDGAFSIDARLEEIEKSVIIEALRRSGGVQVRAAELIGLNQRSLWHRIKKYNIDVQAFKAPET